MTLVHFTVEVIAELKVQKGTHPPRHHPALQLRSSPNTLRCLPRNCRYFYAGKHISPTIIRLYTLFVPNLLYSSQGKCHKICQISGEILLKTWKFFIYMYFVHTILIKNPEFNHFFYAFKAIFHRKTGLDKNQSELWKMFVSNLSKHSIQKQIMQRRLLVQCQGGTSTNSTCLLNWLL